MLTARRGSALHLDIARHREAAGQTERAVEIYVAIADANTYARPDLVLAAADALLAMDGAPRERHVNALLWKTTQSFHMHRLDEAQAARDWLWDYVDVEGVERLVLCLQADADRLVAPRSRLLESYRRALELPKFDGRTRDAYVLSMIGNILLDIGRCRESLDPLQRAVASTGDGSSGFLAAATRVWVGKAHGLMQDRTAMEAWFERAQDASPSGRAHVTLEATVDWCRAQHCIVDGDWDGARALLQKAREQFEASSGAREILWMDLAVAEVDAFAGKLDAAWSRIDRAVVEHRETHAPCQWTARLVRARVARMRGDPVDHAELTDLEAHVRHAEYVPLLLRTRLEQTWGQRLGPDADAEIRSLVVESADPGCTRRPDPRTASSTADRVREHLASRSSEASMATGSIRASTKEIDSMVRPRWLPSVGVEGSDVLRDPRGGGMAEAAPGAIAHMNEDHAHNLLEMCRGLYGFEPERAVLTDFQRDGFFVRTEGPERLLFFPFGREIEPTELRHAVVHVLKRARAAV